MRIAVAAIALLIAPAGLDRAGADTYRWCMEFSMMGSANCYFATLEQCRAAASGNGGLCRPNPFYTGAAETEPPRPKKKK